MKKIGAEIARKIATRIIRKRENAKQKRQAKQKKEERKKEEKRRKGIIKKFKEEKEEKYLKEIYGGIKDEALDGERCFIFYGFPWEDKWKKATGETKIEAEYLAEKLRKEEKFKIILQEDVRGDDNRHFMHYAGSRRVLEISW